MSDDDTTGQAVDIFKRQDGTYGLVDDGESVITFGRGGMEAVRFNPSPYVNPDSAVDDTKERR